MIEGDLGPAVGGMTGAAIGTELTEVPIIVLVASDALHRRVYIRPTRMAVPTGNLSVRPGQREARPVVIEDVIRPGRGDMALAAVDVELAGVTIVPSVAAEAIAGDPDPLALDVAAFAPEWFMAANEIKPGELVGEACISPGNRSVAGAALLWDAPSVNVLFEMAVDTLALGIP